MTSRTFDWPRILRFVTVLAAAAFIAFYLAVALARLSYPYDLEWMEGSMVDHVQRVLDGQSLYVKPTLDFAPFGYPPLYFWAAAGVSHLTGNTGYLPLRLLSILASLGTMWLLYALVKFETSRRDAGLLAAGLFAATYQEVAFWFDVGRVDSLFILLVLAAVYLMRRFHTPTAWIAAGALLGLSFLTKQLGLIVALPVGLYGWIWHRRLAIYLGAAFAVVGGGLTLALMAHYGSWYWYYVCLQPSKHPWILYQLAYFVVQDVPKTLGITALIGIFWLYLTPQSRETRGFYVLLLCGLVGASLLPRMKDGGWDNDLIPTYAGLALFFAIGVCALEARLRSSTAPEPGMQSRLRVALWLACLMQFVGLAYHPLSALPKPTDRAAGNALIAKVASYPGDVLFFAHGYLPRLAGKHSHANSIALTDVFAAGIDSIASPLRSELRQAVREQRYSAIVLDCEDPKTWDLVDFHKYYVKKEAVFDDPLSFWSPSGYPLRPEWIYVPRLDSSCP